MTVPTNYRSFLKLLTFHKFGVYLYGSVLSLVAAATDTGVLWLFT